MNLFPSSVNLKSNKLIEISKSKFQMQNNILNKFHQKNVSIVLNSHNHNIVTILLWKV